MSDLRHPLAELRRPRLLLRAARLGLPDYRRDRDLRRLIGTAEPLPARAAVTRLLEIEEQMESTRQSGDCTYSPCRHIETLIALMSEARLLAPGARP